MQFSGTQFIQAKRHHVWRAIMDPELLKKTIPRCKRMIRPEPNIFQATLTPRLGPVRTKFSGEVMLHDIIEHESYRLIGSGRSRLSGAVDGIVIIKLQDQDIGTIMHYDLKAELHGKLAKYSAKILDKTIARLTGGFFDDFAQEIASASKTYDDPISFSS